jgi:hypothetical protein
MPPRSRRRGGVGRRIRTPFPWDKNLAANNNSIAVNYRRLLPDVVDTALDGHRPKVEDVRGWHQRSLRGVRLAEPEVAGGFRGEGPAGSELSTCQNAVIDWSTGAYYATARPEDVDQRVTDMFTDLNTRLDSLDARLAAGETLAHVYADVIGTCAWVHGEWVRIHPFVDHNGSTARLLTRSIALLYGVILDLPGKPRSDIPDVGITLTYDTAAESQMLGNDLNMVTFLDRLASL